MTDTNDTNAAEATAKDAKDAGYREALSRKAVQAEKLARKEGGRQAVYALRIENMADRLDAYVTEMVGVEADEKAGVEAVEGWPEFEGKVALSAEVLGEAITKIREAVKTMRSIPKEATVKRGGGGGGPRRIQEGMTVVCKLSEKYIAMGKAVGLLKVKDAEATDPKERYAIKKAKVLGVADGFADLQIGGGAAAKRIMMPTAALEAAES